MEFFKKKEKVEPKKYLNEDAMVYTEYDMPIMKKITYFVLAFAVGAVLGYIFYSLIPLSIIAGVIAGFVFVPVRRKQIIEKRVFTIKMQFKDLLEALSTSLGAGLNITDSFRAAHQDLIEQYSMDAYIVKEVELILHGVGNNINMEILLIDLAERSGVEDIMSFANVFETCYRKGGNIKEVTKTTYEIINDKLEIDMEIITMISSAKNEQNMMLIMPVLFVLLLKGMGSQVTGQGTSISLISTTIALILFGISYFASKKITAIKL